MRALVGGPLNLAAAIATSGSRVLVVDADPQGSALAWSSAREAEPLFPVVGMAKPTLHRELPNLAANYHFIVIDGAPRVNDLARSAILASNLVLIPVQPSPYDIWASSETVRLIREARQINAALEAAFLINRKIARSAIGRDAAAALARFEDIPVLEVHLSQRILYAESAAKGLTVYMPERTTFYGAKEIGVKDPQGHFITFAEFPKPSK